MAVMDQEMDVFLRLLLLDELMETDDPFEGLTIDPLPVLAGHILHERRNNVPKVIGFVEEVVTQYSDSDFRRDFRVSREVYDHILQELHVHLVYNTRPGGRPPTPPHKQLLVYLWYIANPDSFREMSRLFGLTKSCVYRTVRRVSKAIVEHLKGTFIKWPNHAEQQAMANNEAANRTHLHDAVGFIDGTHIRLSCIPGEKLMLYIIAYYFNSFYTFCL